MEKLELYDIDLKNFKETSKVYTYNVGSEFFEMIEAPGIQNGNLEVQVSVRKGIGYFTLDFQIEGEVECICDRCLEKLDIEVDTYDTIKVKLGAEFDESNEEMLIIPEYEGIVNVAWYIYEFAYLSLPYRKVHNEGECNEEMLESLSHVLTTDSRNVEDVDFDETVGQQSEEQVETDPRWDALKKILNNN